MLIVNTASECGLTPQYEGLQALHEEFSKEGLAVLGFPCNQFGKQEPGSAKEITEFCKLNYGVTFDMFAKLEVNGKNRDDLYKHLTSQKTKPAGSGKIKWNFEKFLVSREGRIVGRFRTRIKPQSGEIVEAVERALAMNRSRALNEE